MSTLRVFAMDDRKRPAADDFKRRGFNQGTDLDGLLAAGEAEALILALQPEMARAIRRFSGLTKEQREDTLSIATIHLLAEFRAGKAYGKAPVAVVARMRATYVVKDLFRDLAKPKQHGFSIVSLDYRYPHDDEAGGLASADIPGSDLGPEDVYREAEATQTALRGLTPRERQIAVKRCIEDKSAEQAGEELGCTANSVDQTYHRAKKKMRDNLDEYCGGDGQ